MLRNTNKKRIHQEEAYRYEVRARLDKTEQKNNEAGGKIWAFVNSAFFLWVLSSVVVGIISFSYAKWDKQREIEREQRERARKLDAEISSRLTYFFHAQNIGGIGVVIRVEEIRVRKDGSPVEDDSHVGVGTSEMDYDIPVSLSEDGMMSLYNPNSSGYKSSDPEFANRSFLSLLSELQAVVPPQEKNEISQALARFIKVQPKLIKIMQRIRELKQAGKPSVVNPAPATFNELCESVNLKRWGLEIPSVIIQTETAIEEVIVE